MSKNDKPRKVLKAAKKGNVSKKDIKKAIKKVSIERFVRISEGQFSRLGNHEWAIARLITLSADLEVMEIPLRHLNIYNKYESLTLREMVMHFRAVNESDLRYPIVLDEDGEIMDGRHRIMKALLDGHKTIKAVRFDKNPEPCRAHDS